MLAKEGLHPPVEFLWGPVGQAWLDKLRLPDAYATRVDSLRDLVELYNREVAMLEGEIYRALRDNDGYRAIQAIDGVGHTLAAIFVAEIGDIGRFAGPSQLCSWAGLTPKHRESDTKVYRGSITKAGSTLVRWAAIEAVAHLRGGPALQRDYHRLADRRGRHIARVAVARKLLTLVFYGLRDGEIRCLAPAGKAA
ncbi:MAG TPA: transposase [Acidimicrobiales bacterium]|nr:transposase [Acidimicrobiales bacterium]